jgi:hypothetical protein
LAQPDWLSSATLTLRRQPGRLHVGLGGSRFFMIVHHFRLSPAKQRLARMQEGSPNNDLYSLLGHMQDQTYQVSTAEINYLILNRR